MYDIVAASIAEFEYTITNEANKEAIRMKKFIKNLGVVLEKILHRFTMINGVHFLWLNNSDHINTHDM